MSRLAATEENLVENPVIKKLVEKGYTHRTLDELYEGGEFTVGDKRGVLLEETLRAGLRKVNNGLSDEDVEYVLEKVGELASVQDFSGAVRKNKELFKFIEEGVVRNDASNPDETKRIWLVDWRDPENNIFTIVNQFSIENNEGRESRPDLVLFINGIPFVLFEFKNLVDPSATLTSALDGNIARYKKKIPWLFSYNHLIVLSDWSTARYGTLTAGREHFVGWYGVEDERMEHRSRGKEMQCMLDGLFDKGRLIDTLRFFVLYDNRQSEDVKLVCRYHQYYTVNRTVERIEETIKSDDDRVGTIWHTQGSGKTISLAFIVRKCRELLDSPSFVLVTDRRDLDTQISKQFSRLGFPLKDIDSMNKLGEELRGAGQNAILSTTIHKFKDIDGVVNNSGNIIVIADEAHRSQYRDLAGKMRVALPNASFLGVTGTPISFNERDTNLTFGENISEYTVVQAERDEVVVPIYYDFVAPVLGIKTPQGVSVDLYDELEEEGEDSGGDDVGMNDILMLPERLDKIADDVVDRLRWIPEDQKAMFVANTRVGAFEMYTRLKARLPKKRGNVILVLSKYDDLGFDGETDTGKLAGEFKKSGSDVRIAVVCNMWLTGFDVPHLHTLFLDKSLKGHTLMQAIARVNRIYKDKVAGSVIDYIGIVSKLNDAIAQYAQPQNRETFSIPEIGKAIEEMRGKFDILLQYIQVDIVGVDKMNESQQRDLVFQAMENVITDPDSNVATDERKKSFLKTFSLFERLFLLIMPREEAYSLWGEYKFLLNISRAVRKLMTEDLVPESDSSNRQRQELDEYVAVGEIISLLESDNVSINIFDAEIIQKLGEGSFKNLAIEILNKVLQGEIDMVFKRDEIMRQSFLLRLQELLNQYREGILSTKEILENLKGVAKDIKAQNAVGGVELSDEENAVLSALEKGVDLKRDADATVAIAREILEHLREKKLIYRGWSANSTIQLQVRTAVIEIIGKHFGDLEYDTLAQTGDSVVHQLITASV